MVRNDMFYIQYPYMPDAEHETNMLVSATVLLLQYLLVVVRSNGIVFYDAQNTKSFTGSYRLRNV